MEKKKKMKVVNLNRVNLHFMQTSKVKCVNKAWALNVKLLFFPIPCK